MKQNTSFTLILVTLVIFLGTVSVLLPKEATGQPLVEAEIQESTQEQVDVDTVDIRSLHSPSVEFSAGALNRVISARGSIDSSTITLVDLVESYPEPAVQNVSSDIDWERVGQLAGIGDVELLKIAYEEGSVPRNEKGQPASEGETAKVFPWETIAAISSAETNSDNWPDDIDIRQAGPWGSYNGYAIAEQAFPLTQAEIDAKLKVSKLATLCRLGLEAIAQSPDVQRGWPGITAQQIKTSTHCAVGKTQILAVHFAPGGMLAGMPNKNLWTDRSAIVEATTIHLVARESPVCGKGWFETGNVTAALCSYNPNSWGVAEHQWYWDKIENTSATIKAAIAQISHEKALEEGAKNTGESNTGLVFSPPCMGCTVSLAFGTYPFTEFLINIGLAGTLHNGTDFVHYENNENQPVETYAVFDALVIRAEYTDNSGFAITLQSITNPSWTANYYHIDVASPHLNLNDAVGAGQHVGTANGSGYLSSGAHLHFELRMDGNPVDPMLMIEW